MSDKSIPGVERLIFAMDVPNCDQARALADELGDAVTFYKIGLELMMSGGYFELLDWMLGKEKRVFCDLKFFDIPATVGSAVRRLKDRLWETPRRSSFYPGPSPHKNSGTTRFRLRRG